METTPIATEATILEALHKLAPHRWAEVLSYVQNLTIIEDSNAGKIGRTGADLANSDIVGLWADREEMTDSVAYVQSLRKKNETPWDSPMLLLDSDIFVDIIRSYPPAIAWLTSTTEVIGLPEMMT